MGARAVQARTLSREGLLLGRLGGVFGAFSAPPPPADSALGNSEGENRCATQLARPLPGDVLPARWLDRPRPSN